MRKRSWSGCSLVGALIGLDVDPLELPRTEARLRAVGFGADTFVSRQGNFAGLPHVLAEEGVAAADLILADLGVSSMQIDNPDRGFSYKEPGPLDMRMNPSHGEPASQLLARLSEEKLASLLTENADEPHARLIANLLKQRPLATTHAVERVVRMGLVKAIPQLAKTDVKMSVRRTFQALRIAVNDEFARARRASAIVAALSRARRPRRHHHLSLRRRPAREEGVPGGSSSGSLFGRRERGHSFHEGRNVLESAGRGREAALGRARDGRRLMSEPRQTV